MEGVLCVSACLTPLLFAIGMHSQSRDVCQPALAQQTGQELSSMRRCLSPSSTQARRCWASAWYCFRLSSISARAAAFSTASLCRRHCSPISAFHLLTLPWHTRLIRNHLILPCTTIQKACDLHWLALKAMPSADLHKILGISRPLS